MTDLQGMWDQYASKWSELHQEQAKIAQRWMDGQEQLTKFLAGSAPSAGEASKAVDFAELWRMGTRFAPTSTSLPGFDPSSFASTMWGRPSDLLSMPLLSGNQVRDALRRIVDVPELADAGSVERRMARIMELYLDVQSASRDLEAVLVNAWTQANQAFATDMGKRLGGDQPLTPHEALRSWLGVADKVLTRTHRSAEYLEAQRRLLGSAMEFFLAEREVFETLAEPAGLPTRSEIDELHQTVHQLKRRVRSLEKAQSSRPDDRTD